MPWVIYMKIETGTKLRLRPFALLEGCLRETKETIFPCTVVYINKPHRYFIVEFSFPGGKFRESYKLDDVEGGEF